jgi:hypothetical protein
MNFSKTMGGCPENQSKEKKQKGKGNRPRESGAYIDIRTVNQSREKAKPENRAFQGNGRCD